MINQPLAKPASLTCRGRSLFAPCDSAGHAIFVLHPPYGGRDIRAITLRGARAPGAILGIQLRRPDVDPASLRTIAQDLSQRAPCCPVVVLLHLSPDEELRVAARLAPHGFRAVVPGSMPLAPALREALADPTALPRGVVEWLRLRAVRLNPNVADLIARLIAGASEYPDVTSVLDAEHILQSTARWRLHKRRLPGPGRWFQTGRALHAALRLQASPDATTAEIAHELGFSDHSALVHLLRRTLGVGTRQIRDTLGWEWLLDRWFASTRTPVGIAG